MPVSDHGADKDAPTRGLELSAAEKVAHEVPHLTSNTNLVETN